MGIYNFNDFNLSSGCILPNHPEFGKWSVPGSKTLQPGVLVATGIRLNVQCDKNFKREGPRMISCRNSKWSRVPKCLSMCFSYDVIVVLTKFIGFDLIKI